MLVLVMELIVVVVALSLPITPTTEGEIPYERASIALRKVWAHPEFFGDYITYFS